MDYYPFDAVPAPNCTCDRCYLAREPEYDPNLASRELHATFDAPARCQQFELDHIDQKLADISANLQELIDYVAYIKSR